MIKYNNNTVNDWYFDASDIIKVYRNGAVCYYKVISSGTTPTYQVCYAVVDDISSYTDREFVDVFNKADEKWYKLNNLNQYEEYGVYGSGRNITYYDGKLTIDDDYEYQYSGGSWINVGEVSGSTATLPNVPFVLNYNAKNYDATTHSIPMTTGQLNDTDAVAYNNPSNIVDHSADGYITISNSSMRIRKTSQDISLFNRTNTATGASITIVCKAKSTSGENIITNRDGSYNWMYRLKTSGYLKFHGTSETGQIAWNTSNHDIMSVRTYYDSGTKLKYNNWTQNTSTTPTSFSYGSTNTDSSTAGALFVGYGWPNTNEQWSGDFYWVYMSQNTLTDDQVQQVIDYNEGGGGSYVYPLYYDEKAGPLNNLSFDTMEEAQDYAYNNCVYDGMNATIDGDRYVFSGDSTSGYEWVEQQFTQYEYIESQSGGTKYYNISTNFYPTTANTIVAKIEFVNQSIDWGHLISWHDGTNSHKFNFQTVTNGYQAIIRTGGNNGIAYRPTIGVNNTTVYTLPLSATSGTYSVNGGSSQTINYNYTAMSLPASIPMCFFGQGTSYIEKAAVARIYYVKVYDGSGNVVKHYVPSDNNGTPCFYELINGDYILDTYTGSNHGTLTLGPVVN